MLITFILLYLGLTLLIGWWASRKVTTTQDYVIAGRRLPLLIAASALFATWFGSETILGASAAFVEGGLLGVIEDPFGAALCLILVGMFFARPLYRLNILTFNDFFRIRFGRASELISAFFMIPSYFGWIAAQLVAMAIVFNVLTGLPLSNGILFFTSIVTLYTFIGGMWAVSITDFVQTLMIIGGLLMLAVSLFQDIGGWEPLAKHIEPGFFRFLPDADFNSVVHYISAWITIGLGSIPQQDIFQRVMAAKDERTSVRSGYLSGLMYLTIGFIPLFIGLCAKILYPELQEGDSQLVIPKVVLLHGGLTLQILFFGALLSAILSTTSGAILAPATVIGENLIRPFVKELSDKRLLFWMRISVLFVALCSAVMATFNTNIYELVGQSSALSLVSLFVPLTAGLYWKRASKTGTLLSMILGMVVWLWFEWEETTIPSLIYGGLASILGMVAGSYLFPDDSYTNYQKIIAPDS